MFEKGVFLFTFDLRGAYYHISIQEKKKGLSWVRMA